MQKVQDSCSMQRYRYGVQKHVLTPLERNKPVSTTILVSSLPQSLLFKCSYLNTASDLNYSSTVCKERISFRKSKSLWHFWVKNQVLCSIGKVIRSSHTACNTSTIDVRDLSPRRQIYSTRTWNSK